MKMTCSRACGIIVLSLASAITACGGSDSQSPTNPSTANIASSISGTVVYDQTGSPAADVDVILEREAGGMIMGWDQTAHLMTSANGHFRFDYMHDSMHRYRVGVRGVTDWHMCDEHGRYEDGVVLRIPTQTP